MLGPLLDVNGPNGVLVSLVAIGAVRSLMVIRFTVGDSVWLRGDGKIYGSAPASSKYEVGAESWAARESSRVPRGESSYRVVPIPVTAPLLACRSGGGPAL